MKKAANARASRMLCLGDSYTIGEAVEASERFPVQAVELLQERGLSVDEPRIIATTGWTTDELLSAITEATIKEKFDYVTLLIGVNNQYRGRDLENYKEEFELLIRQAIAFADNDPTKVFILSIPDWGVTPFAAGKDRVQISKEIDAFNAANRAIAIRYGAHYLDITPVSRHAITDPSLTAGDGLHPSGKMYRIWAGMLAAQMHQLQEY